MATANISRLSLGLRSVSKTVMRCMSVNGSATMGSSPSLFPDIPPVTLYSRPEYGSIPYSQLQIPFDTFSVVNYTKPNANFLKFDLQKVNFDMLESPNILETSIKFDIQQSSPEVIYFQQLEEVTFKFTIQKALRQLGYDGYFLRTYDDRGMATFFKTDMFRGTPTQNIT